MLRKPLIGNKRTVSSVYLVVISKEQATMTYFILVIVSKEKATMTYDVTYNDLQSDLQSKRKTKSTRASRLLYVVRLLYPLYVVMHYLHRGCMAA